MKTRVIQDDPEPGGHNTPFDVCGKQMQNAMNVAGRMGRWSATHWKTAVFGWLACVVVFFAFGNLALGFKQIDINDAGVGQSHKADQILKKAFPERAPQTEFVLVQSSSRTADDPAFRSTVADVIASVKSNPAIKNLDSPYGSNASLISDDRHAAMVQWEMRGDADQAQKKIDALSAATDSAGKRHPGFFVGHAGVSSNKALDKMLFDQTEAGR
jgi:putative drug exporter of the RND superfamily